MQQLQEIEPMLHGYQLRDMAKLSDAVEFSSWDLPQRAAYLDRALDIFRGYFWWVVHYPLLSLAKACAEA